MGMAAGLSALPLTFLHQNELNYPHKWNVRFFFGQAFFWNKSKWMVVFPISVPDGVPDD